MVEAIGKYISRTQTPELSIEERREILISCGFVRVEGGVVCMGSSKPLVCRLEGRRWNEGPIRELEVEPFWVCRMKVTNVLFEEINTTHERPPQSFADDMPVVDVTYGEALTFCNKLNKLTGMNFRLPTEPEWTKAAAPEGWWFVYKADSVPEIEKAHSHGDGCERGCAPVLDSRWAPNYLGLDQMGHNTSEFALGHYRIAQGQWGAQDDGMYCIARGGSWGNCSYSPRVNRRLVVDVSDRNPRIGFRLAHSDV